MSMRDFPGLLIIIFIVTAGFAAEKPPAIQWQTNYEKALRYAKQRKQPLLLDFYADWCGPCRLMGETTFRDRSVIKVLQQMTCVRVNVDRQTALAQKFDVSSIPRVLVMDAKGTTIVDAIGYQDADALLQSLESSGSGLAGIKFPKAGSAALANAKDSTTALISDLGNPTRRVRERAEKQLRDMGMKAVPQLLQALNHEHLAIRIGAYATLSDIVKVPANWRYDPWAAKPAREKAVRALQKWWSEEKKPTWESARK